MSFKAKIIIVCVGVAAIFLGILTLNVSCELANLKILDEVTGQTSSQLAPHVSGLAKIRENIFLVIVLSVTLGLLMMAAMVIVIVRSARRLLMPLQVLVGAVRSVGAETLDGISVDEFDGEMRELAVAFNEMTNRLSGAVQGLQESERRYRAIVQDQTDFLFRCRPDGTLTFVNDALARYLGREAKAIVGTRGVPFLGGGESRSVEEALAELVADKEVVTSESLVVIEGLGPRWQVWTTRGIRDDARHLIEYQAVGRDITERKAAAREHEELEEKYLQAQKMEAIGQLAGGVAHDFNNLLQVILGFSEIAMLELGKDAKQREMMHEVLNAANRAKALVGQLLAFSRRQVLSVEDIDVNEVIDGITNMIRRIIGEHIALEVVSGPGSMMVKVDRGQLEQVLMNLCVNARDAMPSGGTIRIETRSLEFTDEVNSVESGLGSGDYVLLTVSDTGMGMNEEIKRHIFEPFFTTKEHGEGTGLGLATVYGIVLQHNGFVDLDSAPGEGTTFRLYLPLSETAEESIAAGRAGELPGGTETILVVEDEEVVRSVAQRMLERAGYTVLTAASGQSALDIFERGETPIQMLLCDVVMPGMSGPQTFIEIKKRHPEVRCLFATGYSVGGILNNYGISEITDYVQKPYDLNVLLKKIREVLDAPS